MPYDWIGYIPAELVNTFNANRATYDSLGKPYPKHYITLPNGYIYVINYLNPYNVEYVEYGGGMIVPPTIATPEEVWAILSGQLDATPYTPPPTTPPQPVNPPTVTTPDDTSYSGGGGGGGSTSWDTTNAGSVLFPALLIGGALLLSGKRKRKRN